MEPCENTELCAYLVHTKQWLPEKYHKISFSLNQYSTIHSSLSFLHMQLPESTWMTHETSETWEALIWHLQTRNILKETLKHSAAIQPKIHSSMHCNHKKQLTFGHDFYDRAMKRKWTVSVIGEQVLRRWLMLMFQTTEKNQIVSFSQKYPRIKAQRILQRREAKL